MLWPLYLALSEYRGTVDGKPELLEAMVELSEDCKDSLTEWYHRLTVVGLEKKFYSCKGRNSVTVVKLWWNRARRRAGPGVTRLEVTGDGTGKKGKAEVQLLTPFGELTTPIDQSGMVGRTKMLKVLGGDKAAASIHI